MQPPFLYQEAPRCFGCSQVIESSPVFASLCGHEGCPSTVWHYHHLMQARDHNSDCDHTVPLFAQITKALEALWEGL